MSLRLARGAGALLAVVALTGAAAAGPPPATASARTAPPAAAPPLRFVHQGIEIDAAIEPLAGATAGGAPAAVLSEGQDVRVSFDIRDVATGQPLTGIFPAAWMALESGTGDAAGDPDYCHQQVEEFLGGSILHQPELDLNVYYVLALNDEPSISVVDPLFGFGGTKLLALIELPEPGEDWALAPDRSRLLVTLPERGAVAVAETAGWTLTGTVELGARPGRIAVQADGAFAWVTATGDDFAGVVALDLGAGEAAVAAHVATGRGPHRLALSDDSRYVFVANRGAGTVSVVDVASRQVVAEVATGPAPAAVAWSPLARAAYVADAVDGSVTALGVASTGDSGGDSGVGVRVLARMAADPGLSGVWVAPDGRLGFAVNPSTDRVWVFDTARNRMIHNGVVEKGPEEVAFSRELAYVRHRDSETLLMLPLDELGDEGRPLEVVDVPGGERPHSAGRLPSPAATIIQAPGADAVLVANPADEAIYFYKEGMAAPMGHFKNYGHQPRAVLVVDRSLRERRRPGLYETAAKLRRPGRYSLAFFLDSPRIVHCFAAEVAPDPVREAERRSRRPLAVEAVEPERLAETIAGEPLELGFRLLDPATGAAAVGLTDVTVHLYSAGGHWQNRVPARDDGDGVYRATVTPPEPGTYLAAVASAAGHLPPNAAPRLTLRVRPAP